MATVEEQLADLRGIVSALASSITITGDSMPAPQTEGWEKISKDMLDNDGADFSQFSFGCTLTAVATITVEDGTIRHGTRTPIVVTGGDIVIAASTWIWVEYVSGSGAGSIESDTTEPVSEITTVRWPLAYYTFADSAATLDHICHSGDINIPSVREY